MPDSDPLALQFADDPFVRYMEQSFPDDHFKSLIAHAVQLAPAVEERRAAISEAIAGRREARSGLFPTIDVGISAQTSFARNFSDDPDNILERSRSRGRTDATFSLNQTVLDFGATSIRIAAASSRLRAAGFEVERQADEIALQAIAAWYDVFTYRIIVEMTDQFSARQLSLRESLEMRVTQGVSSSADIVRLDNLIAVSRTQRARYARELSEAEARFSELFDIPVPVFLALPPEPEITFVGLDAVRAAALRNPAVGLTEAQLQAALQDSRAARSETLPRVTAGIEGGRFGVLETGNDYDVRGVVNMQYRFFGAADARADQARARYQASRARAQRVREEAVRLAMTAWTDIELLEDQLTAAEQGYWTARQSRDVVLERFRVTRGTLFDVIDAEQRFFSGLNAYVSSVTELDAARYVLLSRTGQLLDSLDIATPSSSSNRLRIP